MVRSAWLYPAGSTDFAGWPGPLPDSEMMSMLTRFWFVGALMILLGAAACDSSALKPTPVVSPTPRPTVLPAATVGPLTDLTIDSARLTLKVPSTWAAPQTLQDGSIVISA